MAKNPNGSTPCQDVSIRVPKRANHGEEPFYPRSLERGQRSFLAVMLAIAAMYIKGVSTWQAEDVMHAFGIESLSSNWVSQAAKLLDKNLAAWRNRPLGQIQYLILNARYEKTCHDGLMRDMAVLLSSEVGDNE